MNKKYRLLLAILVLVMAVLLLFRQKQGTAPATDPFDRHPAQLTYSKHARCRMECRHIDESEIAEIISTGTINMNKSEPNGRPDPKYAIEGVTHDGQRVRIVIATAPRKTVVVTVIDLGTEWSCNCE